MRFELTPEATFGAAMVMGLAVAVILALPGTAAVVSQTGPATPQSYYLALGDSIAYGSQPTKPRARPSALPGYVDVFAAHLRKLSPNIQVVNYGCPGESTVTFTRGGCPWLAEGGKLHDAFRGPQLNAALSFLRAHPGQVSPITMTLWGNDLAPLSQKGKRAPKAIASFASRFEADPPAAPRCGADRRDHRDRRVESRGRPTRANPAPLPLARQGHRTSCRGIGRPCREHARDLQRVREPRVPRELDSARTPSLARAIRIRPTPVTARWPMRSWPRRATRGTRRRFPSAYRRQG